MGFKVWKGIDMVMHMPYLFFWVIEALSETLSWSLPLKPAVDLRAMTLCAHPTSKPWLRYYSLCNFQGAAVTMKGSSLFTNEPPHFSHFRLLTFIEIPFPHVRTPQIRACFIHRNVNCMNIKISLRVFMVTWLINPLFTITRKIRNFLIFQYCVFLTK